MATSRLDLRSEFLIFDLIHLPMSDIIFAFFPFKPLTPTSYIPIFLLLGPSLLRMEFSCRQDCCGSPFSLPSCFLIVRLPSHFRFQLSGPFPLCLAVCLVLPVMHRHFFSPPHSQFLLPAPPGFLFASLISRFLPHFCLIL